MFTHVLRSGALLFFLTIPSFAFGALIINEIMYDLEGSDTDREWVELLNTGSTPITVKGGTGSGSWRFNDGSGNRVLAEPPEYGGRGSLTIQPGAYLVIARDPSVFLSMHSGGSYAVVRAAMSLSNTGAMLSLINGVGETVSSMTYDSSMGAAGDGNSLQRTSSGFVAAAPTPGAPYAGSASTHGASAHSSVQTENAPQEKKTVFEDEKTIRASAGGNRTAFAGADALFEGKGIGLQGEPLDTARFVWTFGNGDRREGRALWYHFPYPGTYVVVLDVISGKYSASDRITVSVVPAELSIASATAEYIELANNGSVEIDVGGWMLMARGEYFTFPPHTIVLPKQAVLISNARTNLRPTSVHDVSLHYPNGTLATRYEEPLIIRRESISSSQAVSVPPSHAPARTTATVSIELERNQEEIPLVQKEQLLASAAGAPREKQKSLLWLWILAAVSVSIVGAGGVFFMRQRRYAGYNVEEIKE